MGMALALAHLLPSVSAAELRRFDVPAASADISLPKFVDQAGLAVLYPPERLKGFNTRALQGDYEPMQALEILLDGSGLEYSLVSARVISVHRKQDRNQGHTPVVPQPDDLQTVVVPGWMGGSDSHLPAGVNLHRVTADELAEAGFATIPDWAASLTQNQGSGANEDTHNFLREAPTNTAYGSGINLYGIGQRATLILVNGRRLAPSGSAGTFTDISNIPISSIDHIDVISNGAATIYGSDAVGGIVNFVLRSASSAAQSTAASVALSSGSLGEKEFSQSIAKGWERVGGILSVEYYSRDELPASAREQATSDLTRWGGSNFNTLESNPATIVDSSGRFWGVPASGSRTALTPSELLPYPNTSDRIANTWLLPHQERISLLGSTMWQISDAWSLHFDALLNRRRIRIQDESSTAALSVPPSNPYYVNPLGGDRNLTVLYAFGSDIGPVSEQGQVNSGQLTLGFDGQLNDAWQFRGYFGYAFEDQYDVEHGLVNFDVLQQYLASPNPQTAFNPFGAGTSTGPSTIAAIRADGWVHYFSDFESANFSVVGEVPFLAAGPMALTIGSDYRVQSFASSLSSSLRSADMIPTPPTNSNRTVTALFVQSSAPVLSTDLRDDWPLRLDVSGGLRYEHFSDAGATLAPSMGFDLRPADGVSLEGTWARFFRPPNLPDLNEASNVSEEFVLSDPRSPSGSTTAMVWAGNNASLKPETAHSWTLGLSLAPASFPNFQVQATYFNIVSANRILPQQLLPLTVLSDPQYDYLVTRNVSSSERLDVCSHSRFLGSSEQCLSADIGALVDLRLRNVETLRADGFDFAGRYGRDTPIGAFGMNLSATYILHYSEAETPGGAFVDYRNTPHNPTALRAHGGLSWENRGFSISPAVNFQSSYTDTDSIPNRPVSAWTTWDLVVADEVRSLDGVWGGLTTVSLRGSNVFNKQPPFLNNSVSTIGYDPENGDLLGRRISLTIQHRW